MIRFALSTSILAFVFLFAPPSLGKDAEETLIHAGKLIDVNSGQVLREQSILITGESISSVEPGYAEHANLIDLSDATVMPGWIDSHVHMVSELSEASFVQGIVLEPADYAYQSVGYASRTLNAGFTSVRDLGTTHGVALALRRAIQQGFVAGPRVFLRR